MTGRIFSQSQTCCITYNNQSYYRRQAGDSEVPLSCAFFPFFWSRSKTVNWASKMSQTEPKQEPNPIIFTSPNRPGTRHFTPVRFFSGILSAEQLWSLEQASSQEICLAEIPGSPQHRRAVGKASEVPANIYYSLPAIWQSLVSHIKWW